MSKGFASDLPRRFRRCWAIRTDSQMIILCFFAFGDLNQMASFPLHFDFFPRGMYGPIFVIVYVASPARDETLSPTLNGNEVSMIACCVGPNVADKSRAISESNLIRFLGALFLSSYCESIMKVFSS